MGEITIGKLIRLFLLVEGTGIAISIFGMLLGWNAYIISCGGLVMIPGFVFLTLAGTLKAQERALEAAQFEWQAEQDTPDEEPL